MASLQQSSQIELARSTIGLEIEALESLQRRIGHSFELATDMIDACSCKVILAGVGKSGIVARKMAATFCSVGTPAVFVHPVDALHGDFGLVQKGDVVVFISNSGETAELVTLHRIVHATGCKTIGVVGRMESTLAKKCDVAIDASIEREACPLNLAPTSSVLVSIALGDAMAACLMQKREFTADRFSRLHPSGSLGKRLLLRVGDVMHTGEAIPIVAPSMYLKEVLVTLTGKGMGAVLVAAENRHLEGIFTDGDLRRCLERHEGILRMQIDHLMTRSPIVTHSDEMAVHALRIMEDRPSQIAVLPVVDADNRIEGILRLHDLVRAGL